MNIAGFQKVSTIDYPGEIACVIFLHGCNFRCGFCYNPDLVIQKPGRGFSEEYVLNFLKKRKDKLDAVCITGGEPLITLDFGFVKKIRKLGYKIKIDTNGSFLGKLKEMIDLKLVDYIAMDIKGGKENYSEIAGIDIDIPKIEESMRMVHDFKNSEFRTTVVERFHDSDKIVKMGKWVNEVCEGKPKNLFLQGFKKNEEGMVDDDFLKEKNVSEKYLKEMKRAAKDFFEKVEIRI